MIKANIQKDIPLAPLTTWKIGGAAKFFLVAHTAEDVKEGIAWAREKNLPYFILGGGSNILVSDSGFAGLVIKMEIDQLEVRKNEIVAGAGAAMGRTATFAMQNNLAGLEWAVGLPGTVGGAIFGNSNCFGGSTGQSLKSATLLDENGRIREAGKNYFEFSYDYSKIQNTGEIALEAIFSLQPAGPEEMQTIREKISATAAERYAKQPIGKKCAGSVFKSIKSTREVIQKIQKACPKIEPGTRDNLISAGFIIDKCLNLKGYKLGKMQISELHANFLINTGDATALNVKKLIDFVKKECKNKLGIELEEEIKYVGKF